MENIEYIKLRSQLSERRSRLNKAIETSSQPQHLVSLLQKVDSALERIDNGSYGFCEICSDPIEKSLLDTDPLVSFCFDHLSTEEQKRLEEDLVLAAKIQTSLLPKNNFKEFGYEIFYHYQPAGPVSGDYCDLIIDEKNGNIFFIIGDISGKGIAASMLMTHIHAFVHSLIGLDLSARELMNRVNRLFCESSLYSHFVTMVCGKADKNGHVEICNAGHCLPLVMKKDEVLNIDSTGMPLGLFQSGNYYSKEFDLESGDSILLFTDGLSEANLGDDEYGTGRIISFVSECYNLNPRELIKALLNDAVSFTQNHQLRDDLTMMALKLKS